MNVLTVNEQQSIRTLAERGWSRRRITRELGIHRETVSRLLGPLRRPVVDGMEADGDPKPAIPPTGSAAGRRSACEPFRSFVQQGVDRGLSAQRLYQDLVAGHRFTAKYDAVKRFVRGLRHGEELPFRRLETAPGEEAQVDFGQGA